MSDPEIDPYVPPSAAPQERIPVAASPAPSAAAPTQGLPRGLPCEKCGSDNTGTETALRMRPSVIAFVLLGWLFLLVRTAFKPKTETCRDCGSTTSFRTPGNNLALAILIMIVLLVGISLLAEMDTLAR